MHVTQGEIMDNWQSWAAAIFAFLLSSISYGVRRDKLKLDKTVEDQSKLEMRLVERITRIEAEVMTEREVREILQDFLQPFLASLTKIENRTDTIANDITQVKIALALVPKRKDD